MPDEIGHTFPAAAGKSGEKNTEEMYCRCDF
jgi:hypothetical protein